jgi:hypothetical protein
VKQDDSFSIMPVTKRWAARSQLETAIGLWLHHDDPVSIHTLAVAANDCYHAIGEHEGKHVFATIALIAIQT